MESLDSLLLHDDQLRSFRLELCFFPLANHLLDLRWELGTCIPKALLSGNELSPLRSQKKLKSIALITDGECGSSMSTQYCVDLVQFKDLKALAWRGLNRYSDFESVKDCFGALGHQLSSLTLDLVNWDRAMKIWADGFRRHNAQNVPDNFFAQNVLNISPRDKGVLFQSLEHLHLSGVSFCHAGAQMLHSFNIECINSLELRNCPGSLDLLEQALTSGKTLKLRELELSLDINCLQRPAHVRSTEIVCEFIQHVHHLEVLHLMLPEPFDWGSLAYAISTCTCLKSLVMHYLVDRGGLYLIDGGISWPSYLEDVLQVKQLTCFGLSTPPVELVRASACILYRNS
jgi:hypothetical protein